MREHPPKTFEASIGGFMGSSYNVAKDADGLIHKTYWRQYRLKTEAIIFPSQDQWLTFWDKMGKIDIWNWKPRYEDPDVMDGTSWSVHIEIGNKVAKSSGSNAFPENTSDIFGDFLNSVSELSTTLSIRPGSILMMMLRLRLKKLGRV